MTEPTSHNPFPTVKTVVWMTAAATVTALGVGLFSPQHVVGPVIVGVVWAASLLGLAPVAVFASRGVMHAIGAWFAGMGLRMILCLAVALVAVYKFNWPDLITLMTLAATYLVLLAVEVPLIARYLLRHDDRIHTEVTA